LRASIDSLLGASTNRERALAEAAKTMADPPEIMLIFAIAYTISD
jgi:hypothetical protein